MDVTGNHKFWIMRGAKKSWIPASELVVGDLVMFSDRSLHRISKIDVEKLSTCVFNIEVSKNHNYYVGRNGILAHNKTTYWPTGYTTVTSFHKWDRNLAVHTGVPTWKETVDASQANEPNVV